MSLVTSLWGLYPILKLVYGFEEARATILLPQVRYSLDSSFGTFQHRALGSLSTPKSDAHGTPSQNTRSKARRREDSGEGSDSDALPVIVSPSKKRKVVKKQTDTSDLDVWDQSYEEIIGILFLLLQYSLCINLIFVAASKKTWKSAVYDHYHTSLQRETKKDGRPYRLVFVFTCKADPKGHSKLYRPRMNTSHGTKNLKRAMEECHRRRGTDKIDDPTGAQQDLFRSVSKYTPARHRAVIAMRCARSQRPFNMVKDPDYRAEVELLRPGTHIPSPSTVSRDVKAIYEQGSKHIKEYFSVCFASKPIMCRASTISFRNSRAQFTWLMTDGLPLSFLHILALSWFGTHTARFGAQS